jgi:DNA-binding SARP family transcriptional activator
MQARNCLNTALWRLRRQLEPQDMSRGTYLLATPAGEIGFNWRSDHWLDVESFEQDAAAALATPLESMDSAQARSLENALRLYIGDLLEGFYDDWALRERERLRCLYLDGLVCLTRYYHDRRAYEEGLQCGQMLLRHEPLCEEIHRVMMRLYAESGQRALAIRQYQICRQILADELGIEPMVETQILYRQICPSADTPQTGTHGHRTLGGAVSSARRAVRPREQNQLDSDRRKLLPEALSQLRQARQQFEQACGDLQNAIQLVERIVERSP